MFQFEERDVSDDEEYEEYEDENDEENDDDKMYEKDVLNSIDLEPS